MDISRRTLLLAAGATLARASEGGIEVSTGGAAVDARYGDCF